MTRRTRIAPIGRAFLVVLGVAAALGCNALTPSVAPSGPPVFGIDWGRVASVERPANYEETVSPSYVGQHPILRIQGQATMNDVAGLPGGGFVAVGFVPPAWVPVAWTSAHGAVWTIHPMGSTAFTFPVAVATGANGTVVAVGRAGGEPVAWTTRDGITWDRRAVDVIPAGGAAERMTTVAAAPNGFIAGGSMGPELFERHARFWHSADGVRWAPVADDRRAFANAEVRAITSFDGGFVAVGVVGSVQEPTGAVAWTSPDGLAWTRVEDPAFEGAVAASVVPAPWGGVVAVGSQVDRRAAVAWTSPDGRTWVRAPDEPSREHPGGFAWMTDVVAIGDLVISVGVVQGLQRGTAVSWVSRDGLTWLQSVQAPVQEGAEFYAIAPGGPGALAVGAFGAPDSYVPQVWLTPDR